MQLDDPLSAKIVQELRRDGRLTMQKLGERVGLSPSACLRRVRELERSGVIQGYRAVVDPAAVGVGFTAYIAIGLSSHTTASQLDFERAMKNAPQVVECHNITGTVEYMLRVEASDLATYKDFHSNVLGTHEHVSTITTYVVMGSPKDERA